MIFNRKNFTFKIIMDQLLNVVIGGLIILILVSGCNPSNEISNKEELIKTDEAFSNLSKEKGMKYAFLEYATENVVMLRKNNLPLEGIEALRTSYQSFSDTGFVLTWKPLYADIANSGEMGYTYGIYTSTVVDSTGVKTESKGTYVSIWKKDKNGKWKFVLDSGNEGLGEQL